MTNKDRVAPVEKAVDNTATVTPPDKQVKNRRAGRFERGQSGNPATRFKPGHSGNPAGRPKSSLTSALRSLLDELVPNDPQQRTYKELVVLGICQKAIGGDVRAATLVWERIEGKAKEPIESNSDARREYWTTVVDKLSQESGKSRDTVIQDLISGEPAAAEWVS